MLVQLVIENFTIIERVELNFASGMTVFTGETGAGKSILIDALSLILGAKADSKWIRPQCKQADITATFDAIDTGEAWQWLKEHDYLQDSEEPCIIRRILTDTGRSKAYINGKPCPLAHLKSLGRKLIAIHSQHEHHALLQKEQQRKRLDHYAQNDVLLAKLGELSSHIRTTQQALQEAQAQQAQHKAEKQLLEYQIEELGELNFSAEDIEQLDQEQRQLANATELKQQAYALCNALTEEEEHAVSQQLYHLEQQLEKLIQTDESLVHLKQPFDEALINLQEVSQQLNHYAERLQPDPYRLEEVEQTLDKLLKLARKHHINMAELPAYRTQLEEKLTSFDNIDSQIDKLKKQLKQAQENYLEKAQTLSQHRQEAAKTLSKKISQAMHNLGMEGGQFEVKLTTLTENHFSPYGIDDVAFWVSTNPGQPTGPLNSVASGGELSRISLAIQLLTAERNTTPTLIFDEVDVGISGATAEQVGKLLRNLGEHCQVMCVTHLPQVAAQGHNHFQVSKLKAQHTTRSTVEQLTDTQRVDAIAMLLGGVNITEQTRANAKELLSR